MIISSGISSDGIILENESMIVLNGGFATNTSVIMSRYLIVSSGGTANNTTIYKEADMTVSSGGTANNTTIRPMGSMTISSGGTAIDTTISGTAWGSGILNVTKGGTANNTTINSSSIMMVHSGAIANNVMINYCGFLYISSGGTVNSTTINQAYGYVYVSSGGVANFTTVSAGGSIYLSSGGTANSTTVLNSGFLIVDSGTANQAIIRTGGWLVVSNGAKVMNATIYSNGILTVSNGGTATGINAVSGARLEMICAANTYVTGTSAGKSFEINNGSISGFSLSNGILNVLDNGIARDIIVCSGGQLNVTKEKAINVQVQSKGDFQLIEGIASNVSIGSGGAFSARHSIVSGVEMYESGGAMSVTDGGILTGIMTFCYGARVTMDTDSKLLFDISSLTPDKSISLLNDFSLISGTPDYSFTASDTQVSGKYILARGASSFNGIITVQTKNGDFIGILGVGESFKTADASYSLSLERDELAMEIRVAPKIFLSANNETPTQSAALTATTNSDGEIFFSIDNSHWTKYEQAITVTDNITYYFRTTDSCGDTGTNKISFLNIDRISPEKPVASANIATPTNGDVVVSAEFSEDSVKREYLLDGQTWKTYSGGVTMITNGIVSFRGTDTAGNESVITMFEVNNIDKTPPEKPVASADITAPTNGNVVVSAEFSEDSVKKEYSLDGKTWKDYAEAIKFEENGSVSFRSRDAAGNNSETTSVEVTNIDKVAPNKPIAYADVTEKVNNQDVTVTAVFSEDSEFREYNMNGENWVAYTVPVVFSENGTVFFRGIDVAGNVSEETCFEVKNIFHVVPDDGPDKGENDNLLRDGKVNPDLGSVNEIKEESCEIFVDMVFSVSVDENGTEYHNCVSNDDPIDFAKITVDKAMKLGFTVEATDKVKLTLYRIVDGKKGASTKTLSTASLSKQGKKESKPALVEAGEYYIGVENKNKKSDRTFYNVELSGKTEIYFDGDNGDNNWLWTKADKWNENVCGEDVDALVIDDSFLEDGNSAVQVDTDMETVVEHNGYTNYVGFGDAMDIRKIELMNAAKLSFDLAKTSTGAAKLIVYTETNGKMVIANSKLTVTAKAAATSGILKNQAVLDKGVYYIAVQSTDASKGKETYYNVSLNTNSLFYMDGDNGTNNLNSKTNKVDAVVMKDENTMTLHTGEKLRLDGILAGDNEINHDGYINFVGSGDDSDIVRIQANAGMKMSLKATATDAVNLVVYGLQKNGTLKALKTIKSKNNIAELVDFELKAKSAPGGQFFIGVTSTNAKKGSEAYYNVDVISVSSHDADALAMPDLSDNLNQKDVLNFGQYDMDVLSGASFDLATQLIFEESGKGILASL